MRWQVKDETPPKSGEKRSRKVFAWKRTRVGRFVVWLEFYWITEHYFQPASGNPGWWSEGSKTTCDYYC